jgi:cytidyltransferase-like protein
MYNIFFTQAEKNNISNWTYKVVDKSITTLLFTPFWNYIVKYVPPTVAPNIISLAGLLCVIYAYNLSVLMLSQYYSFTCLCVFMLMFAYMTLDAIDGKHARRTGNSSPLGELVDHLVDVLSLTFIVLTACNIYGITDINIIWYLLQSSHLIFLYHHIDALKTNIVVFPKYTSSGEANILYLVSLLISALKPNILEPYKSTVSYFSYALYIVTTIFIVYKTLCLKNHKPTINGIFICLGIRMISGIMAYYNILSSRYSIFNLLVDGLFMSIITGDIICAKMSKRNLHPWVVIFTMMSLLDSFLTLVCIIFYITCVLYELSTYLNKSIFLPDINILCTGVFDMCHIGHMKLFQRASTFGTKLYVGVHSDKDVESYKRTPAMTMTERSDVVKHCKGVSEVLLNTPLYLTEEYLKKYNIHIVVCDDEYNTPDDLYYAVPRKLGILKSIPRTKGISSTKLLKRVYKLLKKNDNKTG